jgi:hypothetical protein
MTIGRSVEIVPSFAAQSENLAAVFLPKFA